MRGQTAVSRLCFRAGFVAGIIKKENSDGNGGNPVDGQYQQDSRIDFLRRFVLRGFFVVATFLVPMIYAFTGEMNLFGEA